MERPILFSGPMVRALLNGSKTQTRRIVKPQPDDDGLWNHTLFPMALESTLEGWHGTVEETGESKEFKCRYGQPGDILWVRETWAIAGWKDGEALYAYKSDGGLPPRVRYEDEWIERWYPSIHMPRKAARIFAEVTEIRVERLQEISEQDAYDEGIDTEGEYYLKAEHHQLGGVSISEGSPAVFAYRTLWESINGAGSWDLNPYCWVIEFKVTKSGTGNRTE